MGAGLSCRGQRDVVVRVPWNLMAWVMGMQEMVPPLRCATHAQCWRRPADRPKGRAGPRRVRRLVVGFRPARMCAQLLRAQVGKVLDPRLPQVGGEVCRKPNARSVAWVALHGPGVVRAR